MAMVFRTTAIAILLATQSACLTSKVVKIGEDDRLAPTAQPWAYSAAEREGGLLWLQYDSTVDGDGRIRRDAKGEFRVDLAELSWRKAGPSPVDAACLATAWRALPPDTARRPVPLVGRGSDEVKEVVARHAHFAAGQPPLSVQGVDVDTWIVCGGGDAIGYAEAPKPPEAQPSSLRTEHVVTRIVLFPFALALDVVGGVLYVAAIVFGVADRFVRN